MKIKERIDKFAEEPFGNHVFNCGVILVASYFIGKAIRENYGVMENGGVFAVTLAIIELILIALLIRPWIRLFSDDQVSKTRTGAMWVGYGTSLVISLLIVMSWVGENSDDTLCYKLTTGETVCYSERQIENEICKNVDCR